MVWVYFDINRLSRNRDTGYYINTILYKHQVNVYTDSGKFDFGSETDRFMFELFKNMSVLENERRRKWSMLGKIQSVKMGRWKGGTINFGYDLSDRKVAAFAGIGRPEKFFGTLREMGADLIFQKSFLQIL